MNCETSVDRYVSFSFVFQKHKAQKREGQIEAAARHKEGQDEVDVEETGKLLVTARVRDYASKEKEHY